MFVKVLTAAIFLTSGIGWAQSQADQPLPDGKGKSQFVRICSQCHAIQVATRMHNTEDGWTGVVNEMVSRGAQGTDDEFDLVIKYLAAHFGPISAKVNINQAPEKDISTLLGITAEDAQAIVHYRETAGNFSDWHDLEKVPHIDLKKLADEKDRIEFAKPPEPAKNTPAKDPK